MRRSEVIAKIRQHADAIHALGAEGVYLYGSVGRDEAGVGSDIDIFVDRSSTRHFGFIELTELEFLLQGILGVEVDISTRSALHPALHDAIEKSAIRVL